MQGLNVIKIVFVYLSCNATCRLTFALSIQNLLFCPLLVCFVMKYSITKDLNLFLTYIGKVTLLALQNNLRIFQGSEQKKLRILWLSKKSDILIKKEYI